MRRIIIREARPGMRVARRVLHPRSDAPLNETGSELSVKQIVTLHELGVYDLWVDDPDLAFFEDLQRLPLSMGQQRLLDALFRSLQGWTGVGVQAEGSPSLLRKHAGALMGLVPELVRAAGAVPSFETMAMQEEELLAHSADVSMTATLLGLEVGEYLAAQRKRMNGAEAREVLNLSLGALLHDVGEMFLPAGSRESRAYGVPEGEEWKVHTKEGFGAVRKHADPSAAAVVLHHHQHFDGTGFAIADGRELRQEGEQIHIFARIARVADVLHHLMSPQTPRALVQALWEMQREPVKGTLDPAVLQALLGMLAPFSPGMVVMLSDRRQAMVTRVNRESPCYPEVQVIRGVEEAMASPGKTGAVIDLSRETKLEVMGVGVAEVGRHLYGRRRVVVEEKAGPGSPRPTGAKPIAA